MMKEILQYLFNHQTLSKAESKSILTEIAAGQFNENEVTAFVTVFLMRSITLPELEGFQEALSSLALSVNLGTNDLVDIVGTGGDGKNTFNISTLASFIVAGTGQKVSKHGNYGISSIAGSSNTLQQVGYVFKNNEKELRKDLDKANICFLHAPLFHPALKSVAPLREGLGLRTFFNILGPLVNPAQPKFSMIGVYSTEIVRLYQYFFQKRGSHTMLVHSLDGYDEISLTDDTKVIDKTGERIFSPTDFGFEAVSSKSILAGNSPEEATKIFLNILNGNGTKEQNQVVIVNAAMALKNTEKYGDYNNCLDMAKESLKSGKALNCLHKLIK